MLLLLQDGELDGQLVVQCGRVAHVLVFVDVLVVDERLGVARVAVAAVVVHVQLLVIVAVVALGAAPGREAADLRLGPRRVWVVQRQRRHARAVQVERVEGVTVQSQLGLTRVTKACNDKIYIYWF